MSAAEQLRDEGMALAEQGADMRVVAIIDRLIAWANGTGKEWSANTIRAGLPASSQGLVGARVNAAAMRRPRVMRRVGWVASNLPSTHGKPIAVWKGVQS